MRKQATASKAWGHATLQKSLGYQMAYETVLGRKRRLLLSRRQGINIHLFLPIGPRKALIGTIRSHFASFNMSPPNASCVRGDLARSSAEEWR